MAHEAEGKLVVQRERGGDALAPEDVRAPQVLERARLVPSLRVVLEQHLRCRMHSIRRRTRRGSHPFFSPTHTPTHFPLSLSPALLEDDPSHRI